jgi:CubicO group peptidase (beta-lactamase class C family)
MLENAWRQSPAVLFTSGGLCASARDLLRWNEGLHAGRVLEPATYQAMTTPEGAARTYGFGLYTNPLEGHPRFRHNGSTPGYSAQLEYYPEERLSIIVLVNSPAAVATLAEGIARVVLGLPARAEGGGN